MILKLILCLLLIAQVYAEPAGRNRRLLRHERERLNEPLPVVTVYHPLDDLVEDWFKDDNNTDIDDDFMSTVSYFDEEDPIANDVPVLPEQGKVAVRTNVNAQMVSQIVEASRKALLKQLLTRRLPDVTTKVPLMALQFTAMRVLSIRTEGVSTKLHQGYAELQATDFELRLSANVSANGRPQGMFFVDAAGAFMTRFSLTATQGRLGCQVTNTTLQLRSFKATTPRRFFNWIVQTVHTMFRSTIIKRLNAEIAADTEKQVPVLLQSMFSDIAVTHGLAGPLLFTFNNTFPESPKISPQGIDFVLQMTAMFHE